MRRLRIVDTPLFGIYLHRIYLADVEYDPHDHPWKFLSVILRGGYRERIWLDLADLDAQCLRLRQRFSVHRFPLHQAHKIEHLEPGTVTLLLRGRHRKGWGFWTADQTVVHWSDYPSGASADPFD